MTDRPSDRAIAQAFWDHDQNCKTAATRWIEDRAREIDAEMPQRAQLDRELVLANQLQDCRLQMKAVWDFLSPNESNDMEWADEIIIAIQNYSLPSQDAEDAAQQAWRDCYGTIIEQLAVLACLREPEQVTDRLAGHWQHEMVDRERVMQVLTRIRASLDVASAAARAARGGG